MTVDQPVFCAEGHTADSAGLRRQAVAEYAAKRQAAAANAGQCRLEARLARKQQGARWQHAGAHRQQQPPLPATAALGTTAYHVQQQVRQTPCRPRSWANFGLSQLYSQRNAWANLHLLG